MKTFTIIHFLIFLLCMLVYQCTYAQPGYLITNTGDSLAGEIKTLFYGNDPRVQIKTTTSKNIYTILTTRKFVIGEDQYFPVRTVTGYKFMKLLSSGYVSLFSFQIDKQQTWDGRYLVKADGQSMELPNIGFKKQMANFLDDCGTVSERIESGELNKRDLDSILYQYNTCVQVRTDEAIHSHKPTVVAGKMEPWYQLEKLVNQGADFDGKANALEMIADIRVRLTRNEKVPNYIIEGLKAALAQQSGLEEALKKALDSL